MKKQIKSIKKHPDWGVGYSCTVFGTMFSDCNPRAHNFVYMGLSSPKNFINSRGG